ncbi:MAG: hypothetical protein MJZ81_08230 [Bacteroidales bacterium]|nr:hypothetical protein [Bacteroidales bacterium]
MKKLSLFFAMMMAVAVWAQMPYVQFRETSKDLNYASMNNAVVLAKTSEGVLAVVPGTRTFMKNCVISGHYFLRMIDNNGNTLREVMLPGTEDTKVFGAILPLRITGTFVDGKAYLAYLNDGKLMRTVIDPATMQVLSSEPMPEVTNEGLVYLLCSYSPSRDFVAMAVASKNGDHLMLLDETLMPLWVKNPNMIDWIRVDDQGNLYQATDKVDESGTHIRMTMHGADGHVAQESATFPQAMKVRYLNADNGVVVAMGVVACDEQSKKDKYVTYDRIAGIAYDFSSRQAKISIENITSDELNVFAGAPTKKPNKVGRADGLVVHRSLGTSFGGVAVVDRCWSVTTRDASTGMTTTDYYNLGTLVMAVDKNARILWHLPFRNYTKEALDDQMFSRAQLFEQGENIYFLHVESDCLPVYDVSNPSARFNPAIKHGKHGLYCIDRQGNVTKSALKLDGCTFGSPFRTSSSSLILFQGLTRGGFADIQF